MLKLKDCLSSVCELTKSTKKTLTGTDHSEQKTDENLIAEELNDDDLLLENQTIVINHADYLFKLILNNKIFLNESFKNNRITNFLTESIDSMSQSKCSLKYYVSYFDKFIGQVQSGRDGIIFQEENIELIKKLYLVKDCFVKLLEQLLESNDGEFNKERFNLFLSVLFRYYEVYLFEKDLVLLNELNSLQDRHTTSLGHLAKSLKYLINNIMNIDEEYLGAVGEFITKSYAYKPNFFRLLLTSLSSEWPSDFIKKLTSKNKYIGKFLKSSLKGEVLDLESIKKTDHDSKSDINADAYTHTLSDKDLRLLKKSYEFDNTLACLKFKLAAVSVNGTQTASSDVFNKETRMADFINNKIDASVLLNTIRNYPIHRKLADLTQDDNQQKKSPDDSKLYDPIYLLPNIYSLLNYGNFVSILCLAH